MKNNPLQAYFYYTRRERNGTLVLMTLCVAIFVLPSFFPLFFKTKTKTDFTEMQKYAQAFAEAGANPPAAEKREAYPSPEKNIELFTFDPNTATLDDFLRLGLSSRTAQTILNYRSKGGTFYKKEDFQKIYALRKEDYARLAPWIDIPQQNNWEQYASRKSGERMATQWADFEEKEKLPVYEKKEKVPVIIDVNLATAEEWQQLRGIGPGYSKRIVNFREKLGGFSTLELVGETYDLPDSTFQQIRPYLRLSPVYRKLNVNTAGVEELKSHPFISALQATILVNYRKQHGAFADMNALKKVGASFKSEDWDRLEPYLDFEE